MIDKKLRKVTLQHCGPVLTIRMTGGPGCLWLHMYLDTETWQMTCDSDIGSYAYLWGRSYGKDDDFIEFCSRWLANEEWLLRKCIEERHVETEFKYQETVEALRNMCRLHLNADNADIDDLDYVFEIAGTYAQTVDGWSAAFQTEAERQSIELPEEWYEAIERDYTPYQKRFAEICREVIAPELKRYIEGERRLLDGC